MVGTFAEGVFMGDTAKKDDWDAEYWGIKLDESLKSYDNIDEEVADLCGVYEEYRNSVK